MLAVRTRGETKGAELNVILCPKFPVDSMMHKEKQLCTFTKVYMKMWEVVVFFFCTTVNIIKLQKES